MKHITLHTIVLIASGVISTGASGQNVYRCGSSYSQKPCPDAVVVEVADPRSEAQKAQADAKTRRETAQVQAIEKAHEKEEAQRRIAQAKLVAADQKKASLKAKETDGTAKAKKTQGASKTQRMKKEPESFVAQAPADKTKPAAKP